MLSYRQGKVAMKFVLCCAGILIASCLAKADSLPVITTQPTNRIVSPGSTATFSVAATGATAFQWRFNGSDIPNATNALLQISDVQTNNTGYYMVIAKNSTGWVPSALAYLATGLPEFDNNEGIVPFSNQGIPSAQAQYQNFGGPITNGMAMVEVGPQLDQMQPVSDYTVPVTDGYFNGFAAPAPSVMPGQTVYFRVDITYTRSGITRTQTSTILKLTATKTPDVADASGLKFPLWPEWGGDPSPFGVITATNQTRIPGETITLTNEFFAYSDFGTPKGQWRKDGVLLPNATNFTQLGFAQFRAVLTISNIQPGDSGIYDVQVLGNNWIIGPKTSVSVQTSNGNGAFVNPRALGTNFMTDLQGIAGRNYLIQTSSNLLDWNALQTVSNASGVITISNAPVDGARFYRAQLLP
jgi:hypothetical protein